MDDVDHLEGSDLQHDLDHLSEVAVCMAGAPAAAAELVAKVLPRRSGEDLPAVRERLVRAALRTPSSPVITGADSPGPPIVTWLPQR